MTSRVFFYHHTLRPVSLEEDLWMCEDVAEYPTMPLSELKASLKRRDESLSSQSIYAKAGKTMVILGDRSAVALSTSTIKKLAYLEQTLPDVYRAVTENKKKLGQALKIIL